MSSGGRGAYLSGGNNPDGRRGKPKTDYIGMRKAVCPSCDDEATINPQYGKLVCYKCGIEMEVAK